MRISELSSQTAFRRDIKFYLREVLHEGHVPQRSMRPLARLR